MIRSFSKLKECKRAIVLANFGGPRTLDEVSSFLQELLCDQDVIQTPFPQWFHRLLFSKIARERAKKVVDDYAKIGGGSPIYNDTEKLAQLLTLPSLTTISQFKEPIITFHRYLKKTHPHFLSQIAKAQEALIFPLFPQYSCATTGSLARYFALHLPRALVDQVSFIASYHDHPAYIRAFVACIQEALASEKFEPSKTILLFSAHGLPQSYICQGDPYQRQCESTFTLLRSYFPKSLCRLSYQSQFGTAMWIKPSTKDVCHQINLWGKGYRNVLILPLSFTSDHIETLFEVEEEYLPPCRASGFQAARCPALNHHPLWIRAIEEILQTAPQTPLYQLIPKS